MLYYLKVVFLSLVAVVVVAVGVFWLLPIRHVGAQNESYATSFTSSTSSKVPTRKASSPIPTAVAKKRPLPAPTATEVITQRPSPTPIRTVGTTKHSLSR